MKESNATGRRYDREFKQNAVELVRAGRSVSRVARDQGVSTWSLGRWVQVANGGQAQSEPKTLAAESDEQCELRRLRQENDYLRQHIVFERGQRLLEDADDIPILDRDIVDGLPTGTVHEGSVYQHAVLDGRGEHGSRRRDEDDAGSDR